MTDPVDALIAETVALLQTKADAMDLTKDMIASIRRVRQPRPASLPALATLPGIAAMAQPETRPLAQALVAAAPGLAWRQTYEEADGFDRHYLDSYGWFDLAGPTGPCDADGIRVMMGVWGQGIVYPDHAHPPEEHYLVLAGGAWFRLGDAPYRRLGPGDVFRTPAGAIHSADMRDAPLLALALWRAEDTSVRINLTASGRDVTKD
ncbi:MAG: dimethylsulfonioproprionate lyase family protein [Paracoccaceae bacterium]